MGNFFRNVFASMLGCLFSFIILGIIFLIIIFSVISSSSSDKKVEVKSGTILLLKFDHPITERSPNNPFKNVDFSSMKSVNAVGLRDVVRAIDHAATDKKISGIYLEPEMLQLGYATLDEVRTSLENFKKSGKFVIAYGETFTQKSFYLASVADKIYLNPKGYLDFRGMASQFVFLKGTLDKLEVETQIFRHGKFKSAIEPFTLDKLSEDNKLQYQQFLQSIWNYYLDKISESRNLKKDSLLKYAEGLYLHNAEDASRLGFVDGLEYKDSILKFLKTKSGSSKEINELDFITLPVYAKSELQQAQNKSKEKIAIVYASGEISGGEGDDEAIGSERISSAIRDARLDKNVKAIVLRVNSPGGSALASEVIWREVSLAKEVKPVVVSMGELAASGGYYISCPASKIVAEPTTITGSIGVFGLMMNLNKFFKNKLGVTFDIVKTNEFADQPSFTRPLTSLEATVLQEAIEDIYSTFIKRVADGRGMKIEEVDKIAQGRIWSGLDAKSIGLVDTIGNFQDAISIAAEMANLKNYSITELPKQKNVIEEIMKSFFNTKLSVKIENLIQEKYPYLKTLNNIYNDDVFYTRLPFDIIIQ